MRTTWRELGGPLSRGPPQRIASPRRGSAPQVEWSRARSASATARLPEVEGQERQAGTQIRRQRSLRIERPNTTPVRDGGFSFTVFFFKQKTAYEMIW